MNETCVGSSAKTKPRSEYGSPRKHDLSIGWKTNNSLHAAAGLASKEYAGADCDCVEYGIVSAGIYLILKERWEVDTCNTLTYDEPIITETTSILWMMGIGGVEETNSVFLIWMTTTHPAYPQACRNGRAFNSQELLRYLRLNHSATFLRSQGHLERRHHRWVCGLLAACFDVCGIYVEGFA